MNYPCPFKYRAFDGRRIVTVQTLCWNQGGALWYGPGNQFGWAWVNEAYDGWNENNPKPGELDVCPLMRWTGLVDKNGVEIWEGDVVREIWRTNNPYGYSPDEWDDRSRDVLVTYSDGNHNLKEEHGDGGQYCVDEFVREVLGNVYESPDLAR